MAKANDRTLFQQALKSQDRFAAEHPEFMHAAREAIRPWEEGHELHITSIAKALLRMHEMGAKGKMPEILQLAAKDEEEDDLSDVVVDIPPSITPAMKRKRQQEIAEEDAMRRAAPPPDAASAADRLRAVLAGVPKKETPAERLRRLTGGR